MTTNHNVYGISVTGGGSIKAESVAVGPGARIEKIVSGASETVAASSPDAAADPTPVGRQPTADEPAGVADGYPRHLSDREVSELAKVFHRPASATLLLADAGIPPARQPSRHGETAEEFWLEVAELVEAGIVADGRARILAAAARRFPGNDVFQRGLPAPD